MKEKLYIFFWFLALWIKSGGKKIFSIFDNTFVSLSDAARILYEKTELTKVGQWIDGLNRIADHRISYFKYSLMINSALYGKRPPSTILRPINSKQMKSLRPNKDNSNLGHNATGGTPVYTDVSIKTKDLKKHIRYLRGLNFTW